eukprot:TRINITY_DN24081_c0_g1_i1.p1 TRINITY_DN24081_c0_g1~~TRINITY_DN24081_c0_g1_i1.p1  ORF type:complete len:377 (-),score=60.17 TRINITY_DN24081_c0_g1_i1:22-1122(-)
MKAVTFAGKERVVLSIVPLPTIVDPTDVIVRVTLAGLCGSDLHLFTEREKGLDIGTVMGHEFVGIVHQVGPKVTKFKVGDRVLSPFSVTCGDCYFCKHELPSRCIHAAVYGWVSGGKGYQGAQAEFVRVPFADSTLMVIPKEISDEEGLFMGDIFATGYFCADNADIAKLKAKYPDSPIKVAVIGCGPVGLMGIISAFSLGATEVFALDSVPERLSIAQKFGAIPVNVSTVDSLSLILERTEKRGVDCVLEAVGSQSALKAAYKLVRPGGVISVIGVQTEQAFSGFSPIEAYDKNITYKVGRCPAKNYLERLLSILKEKKFDITQIITHKVGFHTEEEIQNAYFIFNNKMNNCIKVVFYPSKKSSY